MVGESDRESVADGYALDRLASALVADITIDVALRNLELAHDFEVVEADLLGLSANLNLEMAIRCYIVDVERKILPLWCVDNLVERDSLTPQLGAITLYNRDCCLSVRSICRGVIDASIEAKVDICALFRSNCRECWRDEFTSGGVSVAELDVARTNVDTCLGATPSLESHQLAKFLAASEELTALILGFGHDMAILVAIYHLVDGVGGELLLNVVVESKTICRIDVVVSPAEVVEVLRKDVASRCVVLECYEQRCRSVAFGILHNQVVRIYAVEEWDRECQRAIGNT